MRYNDFQNIKNQSSRQELFHWSVTVQAKTKSRLSPFNLDQLVVTFPVINAVTANVRSIKLQATDDGSQSISFMADVAVFANNKGEAMNFALNPTIISVGHEDAELMFIDPEISIVGESILPVNHCL